MRRRNHRPAKWPGFLYIAMDATNAGKDGGRILFIDPIPLEPIYRNPISAAFEPAEGLMLVFPSCLTNMVEPYLSDHERISLAFNFHFTTRERTS